MTNVNDSEIWEKIPIQNEPDRFKSAIAELHDKVRELEQNLKEKTSMLDAAVFGLEHVRKENEILRGAVKSLSEHMNRGINWDFTSIQLVSDAQKLLSVETE